MNERYNFFSPFPFNCAYVAISFALLLLFSVVVLHMTAGIRKDKTSGSDFPHGHIPGFIYSQEEQQQMISGPQFAYLYFSALTT